MSNIKKYLIIGLILLLCIICLFLWWDGRQKQAKYINVSNELAKKDSLTRILTVENFNLSERYTFLSKDLNEKLSEESDKNKKLMQYLKEKDAKLLFYVEKVQTLEIENLRIAGQLRIDSAGQEYAKFDSTTKYYSILIDAWVKPKPLLDIKKLEVSDSSIVGIYEMTDDGYIKGFITHTNPFIIDRSADFNIKVPSGSNFSFSIFPWKTVGIVAIISGTLGYFIGNK